MNQINLITQIQPNYFEETVRPVVLDAIRTPAIIDFAVANAFRHDNGFIKISLIGRAKNSIGIRLHFWEPRSTDSNIHTHKWGMRSWILSGEIEARTFVESEKMGDRYKKWLFRSDSPGEYALDCLADVNLIETNTYTYTAGTSYAMDVGDIHQISRISSPGAVTVIATTPEIISAAAVYNRNYLPSGKHTIEQIDRDEVLRCLLQAAELVSL